MYLVTTIKQTDDSGYFLNMPHKDFCVTPLNVNMTWLRRIYMQETFQIHEEITYQYFRGPYHTSKILNTKNTKDMPSTVKKVNILVRFAETFGQ